MAHLIQGLDTKEAIFHSFVIHNYLCNFTNQKIYSEQQQYDLFFQKDDTTIRFWFLLPSSDAILIDTAI